MNDISNIRRGRRLVRTICDYSHRKLCFRAGNPNSDKSIAGIAGVKQHNIPVYEKMEVIK